MTTTQIDSCSFCRTALEPTDRFCQRCGRPVHAPPPGPEARPGRVRRQRPGRVGSPLPVPSEDEATRLLCSTAHLRGSFAEFVADQVVETSHRAIYPCHGINLLALARHAAEARRRWRARDGLIVMVRLAWIITFIAVIWVHAKNPYTSSAGRSPGKWILCATILSFVAVVIIMIGYEMVATGKAVAVMDLGKDPEGMAPPLNDRLESRLRSLDDANVVVFSGIFGSSNPFAGNGIRAANWTVTLDASLGAPDDHGNRGEVAPFDAVDVHRWLAGNVPTSTLPDLAVRDRLYVSGLHAADVPGLVPRSQEAPATHVNDNLIESALREPTNYARTYLCFEKSAWGGQLGLSYLIRAQILQQKTLFIEGVALALLPLHRSYYAVTSVSQDPNDRFAAAFGLAFRRAVPALLGKHGWRFLQGVFRRNRDEESNENDRPNDHGVVVDYGARASIRQMVAADGRQWYFASVDEEMYLQVLQRRILEHLLQFLKAHNVDTSEFEQRKTSITNASHFGNVYNVGNVSGSGNVVGDGGQSTINDQKRSSTSKSS